MLRRHECFKEVNTCVKKLRIQALNSLFKVGFILSEEPLIAGFIDNFDSNLASDHVRNHNFLNKLLFEHHSILLFIMLDIKPIDP